ncbi:hypothetical protein, conserved [Plasmodium ovale curtisi]|uniref:Uncharacterized protein n=1 Tax=Plasmodium ovale curtisi TaxID=864141 RepID=A0A1A8W7V4_PLAOA|nr:hypothetical protein, conserved [Plasmodium ovale curtisi]
MRVTNMINAVTENVYAKEIDAMNDLNSSNIITPKEETKENSSSSYKEGGRENYLKKNNFMKIFKKKKKKSKVWKESISNIYDSNYLLSNPNNIDSQKYYLSFSELNKYDNLSDKCENNKLKDNQNVQNLHNSPNSKKSVVEDINKKKLNFDKKLSRDSRKKLKTKKKKKKDSQLIVDGNMNEEGNHCDDVDKNYNFEPHEDLKKEIEKIKIDIDKIKKKGNLKRIYDDLKYILLFQNEIIDILIEDIRKNKLRTKYDLLEDSTVKDDVNKMILNNITLDLLKFKYVNTKLKELIICVYDTKKFNSLVRKIVYNKLDEMKKIVDKNGELTYAKTMLNFLYKQLKLCLEEEVNTYYSEVKNLNDDIFNIKKNVMNIIFKSINDVCSLPDPNQLYSTYGKGDAVERELKKKRIMCPVYQKDINSFFCLYDSVHEEGRNNSCGDENMNADKFKNYCSARRGNQDCQNCDYYMVRRKMQMNVPPVGMDKPYVSTSSNRMFVPDVLHSHPTTTQWNNFHNSCIRKNTYIPNGNYRSNQFINQTIPLNSYDAIKNSQQRCHYVSNLKIKKEDYLEDLKNYYCNLNPPCINKTCNISNISYALNKNNRRIQSSNNLMLGGSKTCSLFCNDMDKLKTMPNYKEYLNNYDMVGNGLYMHPSSNVSNDDNKENVRILENSNYNSQAIQNLGYNLFVNDSTSAFPGTSYNAMDVCNSSKLVGIYNNGNNAVSSSSYCKAGITGGGTANCETKENAKDTCMYTGFEIISSKEDIKRLETFLNDKWGSFKLFEKWVKDCSKWQWIDLKLQREYINSNIELEKLKEEKKKYLEKCINNKIKELWCARMKGLMNLKLNDMEKKIAKKFSSNSIISNNIYDVTLDYERNSMCYHDLYAKLLNAEGNNKKIDLLAKYHEFKDKNSVEEGNSAEQEDKKDSVSHSENTKYVHKKKGYVQSLIYSFNKKSHKQSNKDCTPSKKEEKPVIQKRNSSSTKVQNSKEDKPLTNARGSIASVASAASAINTLDGGKGKQVESQVDNSRNRNNDSYIGNGSYQSNNSYLNNSYTNNSYTKRNSLENRSQTSSKGDRPKIKKKGNNNGSFFDSFFLFKSEHNKKSSDSGSANSSSTAKTKSHSSHHEDDYSFEYSKSLDKKKQKKRKKSKKSNISALKKIFYLNRKKKSKDKSKKTNKSVSSSSSSSSDTSDTDAEENKKHSTKGNQNYNISTNEQLKNLPNENNTINKSKTNLDNKCSSSDDNKYNDELELELEYDILEKEVGDHLHIEDENEKMMTIEDLGKEDNYGIRTKSYICNNTQFKSGGKLKEEKRKEGKEIKRKSTLKGDEFVVNKNRNEKKKEYMEKERDDLNELQYFSLKRGTHSIEDNEGNNSLKESRKGSKVINKKCNVLSGGDKSNKGDEENKEYNYYKKDAVHIKRILMEEKVINENIDEEIKNESSRKNNSFTNSYAYYSNEEDNQYEKYSKLGSFKKGNKKNKFNKFFQNLGKFSFKASKKKGEKKVNYTNDILQDSADSDASNEPDEEKLQIGDCGDATDAAAAAAAAAATSVVAGITPEEEVISKGHTSNSDRSNKSGEQHKRKMSNQVDKLYSYINRLKEKKRSSTDTDINTIGGKGSLPKGEEACAEPDVGAEKNDREGDKLGGKISCTENKGIAESSISDNNANVDRELMIEGVKKEGTKDDYLIKMIYSSKTGKCQNGNDESREYENNFMAFKSSPRFGYSLSNQDVSNCDENIPSGSSLADNESESNLNYSGFTNGGENIDIAKNGEEKDVVDKEEEMTKKKKKDMKRSKIRSTIRGKANGKGKGRNNPLSSNSLDSFPNRQRRKKSDINDDTDVHNEIVFSDCVIDNNKIGESMYSNIYLDEKNNLENISKKLLKKKKRFSKYSNGSKKKDDENSSNSLDIVRLSSFKSRSEINAMCSNSKMVDKLSYESDSNVYMSEGKKGNSSYYKYVQSILPFGILSQKENSNGEIDKKSNGIHTDNSV